ncbi:MAG TPA: dockerin [Polyangia bacterium]
MGIVGTGQSLAVGNLGVPVNTFDSVFHNLKISLGKGNNAPPFDPNDASLSVVPLTEPIRALVPLANYPSAYPANIFGETPHSFMADQISTLYAPWNQGEYVTVHSVVGESGQGIAVIGKGAPDTGHTGRAYAATLFEVKAITRLAKAAGKTYGVGAIIFTHGEQDATNKTYGAAVHQLWSDYNTDLAAITGQTTSIPMLLTQQHSAPFTAGSAADSTQAAWQLGVMYPGDFICAGPKYQYQYQSEGRHLTTPGYDRLGAKYAQVYYQAIALGQHWQPLQPKSVMKSGKTITIDFNVPVAPLNWDENILPPHQTTLTEWAKGRGFEVRNASGRATIDSVAIVGSTVVLTLAADSQASGWVVGYATVQDDAGMMAGPTRGRRGQLRDSDPFVAVDAQTIACTVTNGSAQIQARTPGAFRTREGRDLAAGVGLKPETIVLTKTSDSAMTLSQPWTGASGTADIDFRNDQRNYCVSFEMPVP